MAPQAADGPATQDSSEMKAVVQHIRDIVAEVVQDYNDDYYGRMHSKVVLGCPMSFDNQTGMDLAQRIQGHRALKKRYPEYYIHWTEPPTVDTQEYESGFVRAFLNYEIRGAPPGFNMPGVAIFDFRLVGDKCTAYLAVIVLALGYYMIKSRYEYEEPVENVRKDDDSTYTRLRNIQAVS